jgi:hypothetical protein
MKDNGIGLACCTDVPIILPFHLLFYRSFLHRPLSVTGFSLRRINCLRFIWAWRQTGHVITETGLTPLTSYNGHTVIPRPSRPRLFFINWMWCCQKGNRFLVVFLSPLSKWRNSTCWPRPLPSTSFPILYLPIVLFFDTACSELPTASWQSKIEHKWTERDETGHRAG